MAATRDPLFLVAGTFVPLDGFPEWTQVLSELNPLHHTVEVGRDAVLAGFDWVDLLRVGSRGIRSADVVVAKLGLVETFTWCALLRDAKGRPEAALS